jgi:DNA-binding transcriptional LysR family regulator
VELRDIEIFLMLAQELHFGRTAERLHVSQARVSQAIKKQERQIGGGLFERTSRNVTLTPLGAQLRDDLRVGYDTIQTGLTRASGVARGVTGTLRVGAMGFDSLLVLDVVDRFRSCNPECDVEIPEIHFSDPFGPLRRDEADIVVLWRPIREPDLTEGPVVFKVRHAMAVSANHGLADRASVSMDEYADHVAVDPGAVTEYWLETMLPSRTLSGRLIPRRGPRVRTVHELLTLVAAGKCVSPIGEHAGTFAPPGVVVVPIHDAPLLEWALVWRTDAETPLIHAFTQAARNVGPSTLHDLVGKADQDVNVATDMQELGNGAA